ncbi:FxsA family protein [candidate division NPL-UPA2 bacterium]|nr:FxsA family protein [candidate division NPL-UPA2 bacterium]
MLGYLILLFTVVPVVELALLIKLGQHIGVSYTLAIVILTGVAGGYLARSQGLATLRRIQDDINKGVMPADKIFDGVLIFCGGILLLTPGLITDLIGFMALVPFTRRLIKLWLKRKAENMIAQGRVITITSSGKKWD